MLDQNFSRSVVRDEHFTSSCKLATQFHFNFDCLMNWLSLCVESEFQLKSVESLGFRSLCKNSTQLRFSLSVRLCLFSRLNIGLGVQSWVLLCVEMKSFSSIGAMYW